MWPDFPATVRALAEAIADRETGAAGSPEAAAAFVLASFRGMPAYLRPPLRAATLFFDAWPAIRRGRPFHRLPVDLRLRQFDAWERSPIGPARMLTTFFASLIVFSLWSNDGAHG
ncbi:hypothetical protein DM806_15445 [Sphingobium lactosutens]|uniref:hypothetical protein n=1 Tax=Sphingobium lactosutens TaxID=522773 RepID=UPI0015BAF7CD|nr:hypothetical protein [Sphingobium lactosutens]NWK97036.1 hypothetical protein [Sphingobium lactosutens]